MAKIPKIVFGAVLVIIAYWISRHNYLFFHSFAEVFSIAIAAAITIIAYHSRTFTKNHFLLITGTSFMFVGLLDLFHVLSFRGMGVFTEYGANLPTQFWICARSMQMIFLLSAFSLHKKDVKTEYLISSYALVTALLIALIFAGLFPACYDEINHKLTLFKIVLESAVCIVAILCYWAIYKGRIEFTVRLRRYMLLSVAFFVASEISFCLYFDVYGFFNYLGHIFKIVSFYYLYKAVIKTVLSKPYQLLFKDLKKTEQKLEKDIADRKLIEESLRQSERQFRIMGETVPYGVWLCGPDGDVRYFSQSFQDLLNMTQDQLQHFGWTRRLVHQDVEPMMNKWLACCAAGSPWEHEHRIIDRDGKIVTVLSKGLPVRNENGAIICWVGVHLDITERKRSEEELAKANQRLAMAQQAGRIGSFEWDIKTGTIWTSGMEHVYGLGTEFTVTTFENWKKRIHPEDLQKIENTLRDALGNRTDYQHEYRILWADNSIHWVGSRATILRDAENKAYKVVGANFDITTRKQAENELQKLNELLEHKISERTAIAEQRAQQLRALAAELTMTEHKEKRKLAHLLHDHLQQLLAAAKLKSSLLKLSIKDEDLQPSITEITDLLAQSIQCSRDLSIELSPPALNEAGLTAGLKWLVNWFDQKHSIMVEFKSRPEIRNQLPEEIKFFVFAAAREMLFNVVKHARVKKALLKLTYRANSLYLAVVDKGKGFDHKTIQNNKSSGFGLFSIKERIELLGGQFIIKSSNKGTTSLIKIPVRVKEFDKPPKIAKGFKTEKNVSAGHSKIRILLADDHHLMREGLAAMLKRQADIEIVAHAADGETAMKLAAQFLPDVAILDVNMPRLNGIEAAKQISLKYPDITIIGLSMHASEDIEHAMRSAGAVAYFSKDGSPELLLNAIRHTRSN